MSSVFEQINLCVEEGGGESLLHEHTGQTWNVSLHIGNFREKSRVVALSLYGNAVDKADVLNIHTLSLEIMKVWSQFGTHRTPRRPLRGTFGPGSGAARALAVILVCSGCTDLKSRFPVGATWSATVIWHI